MSELIPRHGGYRSLKSFQVSRLIYDVTARFVDSYIDRFSRTKDQMVQAARSGVQNIAEGSEASATSKKTELKLTQVARASLEELKLDYEDFLRQQGLPLLEPRHPALVRFKQRRCRTLEEVQAWVAEEWGRHSGAGDYLDGQGHTDGHGLSWTNTDTRIGTDGGAGRKVGRSAGGDVGRSAGVDVGRSAGVDVGRDGVGGSEDENVAGISRGDESPGVTGHKSRNSSRHAPLSVPVSDSPCPSVSFTRLSSACLAANAALSLLNLACHLLDRQVEKLALDFENQGGFTERLYRVRTAKRRGG